MNQYVLKKENGRKFVLQDSGTLEVLATISYDRGAWFFSNLERESPIYINKEEVLGQYELKKRDKIKIGRQTIHWSDYYYEGSNQTITLEDFFSYHGRVNRANFGALTLLALGLLVGVYFLPVVLVSLILGESDLPEVHEELSITIAPIIHSVGFGLIAIIMLLLAVKRMRDAGHSIWKLFIPFYNIKVLYLEESTKL